MIQPALRRSQLKEHIARVAARLFYEDGIHAVGMDRVADAAEVTKRTVYHHYSSKDDLVAAALRNTPGIEFPASGPPLKRILGAFEGLAGFLRETDFRGCPYIIFTAELTDRAHPARQLIERRVARRREWFKQRLLEAGLRSPEMLAEQLDVLFDGALAACAKRGGTRAARAAATAARTLLSAARR